MTADGPATTTVPTITPDPGRPPPGYTWEYIVSGTGAVEVQTLSPPQGSTSPPPRSRWWHRRWLAFGVAVVVIVAGVGLYLVTHPSTGQLSSGFYTTSLPFSGWAGCYPEPAIASYGSDVYVAYLGTSSVHVYRSTDAGHTWITLPMLPLPGTPGGGSAANGWMTLSMSVHNSSVLLALGTGGSPCPLPARDVLHGSKSELPNSILTRLVAFSSSDAGESWSTAMLLNLTVSSPYFTPNIVYPTALVTQSTMTVEYSFSVDSPNGSTPEGPFVSMSGDSGQGWSPPVNLSQAANLSNCTFEGMSPWGSSGVALEVATMNWTTFQKTFLLLTEALLPGGGVSTLVLGAIPPIPVPNSNPNLAFDVVGLIGGESTDVFGMGVIGVEDLSLHGDPFTKLPGLENVIQSSYWVFSSNVGSGYDQVVGINVTSQSWYVECWKFVPGSQSGNLSCKVQLPLGPDQIPTGLVDTSGGWVVLALQGCFGGAPCQGSPPPEALVTVGYTSPT